MILTCPECATAYFVDESKIPPEGRMVKCAACGTRWMAHAAPDEPVEEPEAPAEAEPAPAPEPDLALDEPPEDELTGEDLPKVFRAKADTSRRIREAAATGIVWAGMAAAVAVIIALAIVFRVDVVRLWPKSAAAYASVGLPVNSLGLAIEGVKAQPSLKEGHAALSISGTIRNIEGRAIVTPPLKISLLDKDGKALSTKIARAADPRIPPGETRHFALVMLDPPAAARDLEIAFAPEAKGGDPAPAPEKVSREPLDLRGGAEPAAHAPTAAVPMPVEAQPLLPGSPDALDPHPGGEVPAAASAHD